MSKDRRIDIEEIGAVTVVRLLEKKILDEANIEAAGSGTVCFGGQGWSPQSCAGLQSGQYLSSAALGKLVSLEKKMNLAKGKLVLCNIRKDIYEVFKLLQLGKVLTICSDLDEAAGKF